MIQSTPRLRNNIAALSLLQVANYAVPFITIPYLARVLGPLAYGKVAYAQVLMTYFVMLVDFGFSLSATRKIAAHREDRAYVSRVFIGTWTAQWLLVMTAATTAASLVWFSHRLRPDALLYTAAFTSVVGTALFPMWFLQGLERLQIASVIQVSTRLLALLPIFTLVTTANDLVRVPLITGGSVLASGVLALAWIRRQRIVDWHWPTWRATWGELHDSLSLFGANVSISFYTSFVPLALGWFVGPVAVADFTIANKARSGLQSALTPLSAALYPRMSHLFAHKIPGTRRLVKYSVLFVLLVAGLGGAGLFVSAHWVVLLLAGNKFIPAVSVLRWLAFLPLIIGLSNVFGIQIMLARNMVRAFNTILASASVLGVLLAVPLISYAQANGAAAAMVIVELAVTTTMGAHLWRRGLITKTQGNRA